MLTAENMFIRMWQNLEQKGFVVHNVEGVPNTQDFVRALSSAIVEEIKTTAVVNITVTGVCVAGTVTGSGVGTVS